MYPRLIVDLNKLRENGERICAMAAKARMQKIMIRPPMIQARMPRGILPSVFCRTVWALKNTPEPMTIPTTMQIAVKRPYFFSSLLFSMFPYFLSVFLSVRQPHNGSLL